MKDFRLSRKSTFENKQLNLTQTNDEFFSFDALNNCPTNSRDSMCSSNFQNIIKNKDNSLITSRSYSNDASNVFY